MRGDLNSGADDTGPGLGCQRFAAGRAEGAGRQGLDVRAQRQPGVNACDVDFTAVQRRQPVEPDFGLQNHPFHPFSVFAEFFDLFHQRIEADQRPLAVLFGNVLGHPHFHFCGFWGRRGSRVCHWATAGSFNSGPVAMKSVYINWPPGRMALRIESKAESLSATVNKASFANMASFERGLHF